MVVCNSVYTVQNSPNVRFQMIGISPKFSFDVTNHLPPWMTDLEDEEVDARRRPRTPVLVSESLPPPVLLMDTMQVLIDMGFVGRLGEALCRTVVNQYPDDLERIVHELTLYSARANQS
jgi:hypothetical protein